MHFTRGIILRVEDFRERDERVTLYTKDFGKVSVVAKGAKRIEAKLRGSLDIFNLVEITFVEGQNFNILTNVDLLTSFSSVTKNPHAYRSGISVLKVVDYIFDENIKDEPFFEDLHYAVKRIDEYSLAEESLSRLYSWLLLKKFQMKILENQGYESGVPVSGNSLTLLKMLQGEEEVDGVKLSRGDLINIESSFARIFSYIFNYKLHAWIPIT